MIANEEYQQIRLYIILKKHLEIDSFRIFAFLISEYKTFPFGSLGMGMG